MTQVGNVVVYKMNETFSFNLNIVYSWGCNIKIQENNFNLVHINFRNLFEYNSSSGFVYCVSKYDPVYLKLHKYNIKAVLQLKQTTFFIYSLLSCFVGYTYIVFYKLYCNANKIRVNFLFRLLLYLALDFNIMWTTKIYFLLRGIFLFTKIVQKSKSNSVRKNS